MVAAFAVALVVAEVVARVVLSRIHAMPVPRPEAGRTVKFSYMLQPAVHPDIVYELQPHLDCVFEGAVVRTNSHGWRGPEYPVAKPAGGLRILALGDSVLFGWGVPWEQAGAAQLEQRLRAALPGRSAEVIATGVPGYNTAMQAELLRQRGLQFRPDIVVVDYVANDLDLPNFLLAPTNFWRLDRSFLVDLARRLRHANWQNPWLPFEAAPMTTQGAFESDPERVPAAYRHLVGIDAYRRAIRTIVALGREHGFRVLVASHYGLPADIRDVCAEMELPIVEVAARIGAWLRENGNPEYVGSALTVGADDPHPSAVLHGWWADAVLTKIRELRWLPE